jgi:hypothetical protein
LIGAQVGAAWRHIVIEIVTVEIKYDLSDCKGRKSECDAQQQVTCRAGIGKRCAQQIEGAILQGDFPRLAQLTPPMHIQSDGLAEYNSTFEHCQQSRILSIGANGYCLHFRHVRCDTSITCRAKQRPNASDAAAGDSAAAVAPPYLRPEDAQLQWHRVSVQRGVILLKGAVRMHQMPPVRLQMY